MQDLAMMMLDIANNSLRAGAKTIIIRLLEDEKKDRLGLSIEDDGCGMDEETLQRASDPFYTSRTTRKIGLGLAFFKGLSEQCEGNFTLRSKPGKGTLAAIEIRRSHWDAPPLGNIAESLAALIQANPAVNLDFQYQKNEHDFVFQTEAVKQILEDVPLNDPEILLWLKEYIDQQMQSIEKEGETYEITGRS